MIATNDKAKEHQQTNFVYEFSKNSVSENRYIGFTNTTLPCR